MAHTLAEIPFGPLTSLTDDGTDLDVLDEDVTLRLGLETVKLDGTHNYGASPLDEYDAGITIAIECNVLQLTPTRMAQLLGGRGTVSSNDVQVGGTAGTQLTKSAFVATAKQGLSFTIYSGTMKPNGDISVPAGGGRFGMPIMIEGMVDLTRSDGDMIYKFTHALSDTTAPTISSTVPTDAATGVDKTANLTVNFSEDIRASYVNSEYFMVIKASDGTIHACTVSGDADNDVITINPDTDLDGSTAYILIIGLVRDLAGNQIAAETVVNFTTGA